MPTANSQRKPNSVLHSEGEHPPAYLFLAAVILLFFFVIFLLLFFLRFTARAILFQLSLPVSRNSSTSVKFKCLIKGWKETIDYVN